MKQIVTHTSLIYLILTFNGCFSTGEVVEVSSAHLYNSDYGVLHDPEAEEMLEREILVQQNPVEVKVPETNDPNVYLEPKDDPEAVTEDKLVFPTPVITYKYPFDPKFYHEDDIKGDKKR